MCRLGCHVQNYANRTECFRCSMPKSYYGKHTPMPMHDLAHVKSNAAGWRYTSLDSAQLIKYASLFLFRLMGSYMYTVEKKKQKKQKK